GLWSSLRVMAGWLHARVPPPILLPRTWGDQPTTDRLRSVDRGGIGTVVLSAPAGGPVAVGGGTVRPGLFGLGGGDELRERLLPPRHGLQERVRPDAEGLPDHLG